jgi:hypothetical protein
MNFFKKESEVLLNYVSDPSLPWKNRVVISAAGIIASGWTNDNNVFLFSSDGYSVSDPITGLTLIRNYDEDNSAINKFSKDNLEFTIDELEQNIKIFGLRGGNGTHLTTDYWSLESFHPSLGIQIVGLRNPKTRNNEKEYWKEFELISLDRLEYTTLFYGFSPNQRHFGIFGSAGVEIFTRDETELTVV